MMSEWKEYKFGDGAEFLNGRAYKAAEFKEQGTPIVRIQNLTGKGSTVYSDLTLPENKYIEEDDLIYAWSATFGPYIWKGPRSIYHYHIWKIQCNERLLDKYFFYYHLLNVSDRLKDSGNGTLFVHITKGLMESFEIHLPSLEEQEAITAVLSALDDKIDLLHRQNKTLESMAQALFRHWFIDNAADDWAEGRLEDLIELKYGKGLKSSLRSGDGFPVVGSSGVIDYHSEFLVEAPGIVIGRKGTLGEVIYLSENFFPIDTTYFVKSKMQSANLYFEYFLLKSIAFQNMNTDSAVPGLNRNIALATEVVVPPQSEISRFNKVTHPLLDKIQKNKAQIATLEKLRDTLLPKLMSGEVRVRQN